MFHSFEMRAYAPQGILHVDQDVQRVGKFAPRILELLLMDKVNLERFIWAGHCNVLILHMVMAQVRVRIGHLDD